MPRSNLKFGVTGALPALAFCVPVFAQTLPITSYKDPATGAIVTTMELPPPVPVTGPGGQPISLSAAGLPSSPRLKWVPGHYTWDPPRRAYAWVPGQYVEPPPGRVRWNPGRWDFRATGFVWLPDHWD
jgi:hypothetical protein